MKKLKSERNAPLQFISHFTPEQCQLLLEQHFGDTDDELFFKKTDETLTQFRVNFQEGLTEFTAVGSLKSWMGGEQTHVTCQVQKRDATSSKPTETPMGLHFFSWIFIGGAFGVELFKEKRSPVRRARQLTYEKAVSLFYARLMELLAETEPETGLVTDDYPITLPLESEPKRHKDSGENHTNKIKHGRDAPLQFVSPYPQVECLDRLDQYFSSRNGDISFNYIDDTLTEFHINYREGFTRIIANGSLKAWAAGEQTRVICQIQQLSKEIHWVVRILTYIRSGVLLLVIFAFVSSLSNGNEVSFILGVLCLFTYVLLGDFTEPDKILEVIGTTVASVLGFVAGLFAPFSDSPTEMNYWRQFAHAKAESQLYDRLIALLNVPETS